MYKKFFIAVTFLVTTLAMQINFCQAMPYSEMYLGGLTIGSSIDEMRRIYGEPTSHKWVIEVHNSYQYGNTVTIDYNGSNKKIGFITISADNGWKTPRGLAVGDNISKALDMYGNPDYTQSGNFKTAYCYFHESYNTYSKMNVKDFGFVILFNKESGKILQLALWGDPSRMAGFDEYYQDSMKRLVE